ncbi:SIR2-domain-containing protein [Cutaneotrichosporon oleaginosum]|uniref:SIR2-domain-containing protein n=1 Tax=Cutaneotrichosporon oleaginosum TaxID=879819 RepID=A0A0J0XMD2_9TREE|nr:SIR2-domain-containing protein [Cutaneotrichosporon oleaginosum]KLT42223.1 SIR2-domain-containing protein [Cutaneotrichosporon oleaginosum]TXT11659.1 hypothetical protein COLE_02069 [Cutaneotrichosporon oleaginosum]
MDAGHAAPRAPSRGRASANASPTGSASSPPLVTPGDTYQVDSEGFSSDESLPEDEYELLVQEADAGFTDAEVAALVSRLKEDGLVTFLRTYLAGPHTLRKLLISLGIVPPRHLRAASTPDILLLPFAKVALSRILRRRTKLAAHNSVADALALLRSARRIMVLSGAGISTSCGIPDFRSATGLYATLQAEGKYELDDPQQMFDIAYFREHPEVFYSFAKQIYPSNFVPSPCHRWIKMLEDRGVLLRNYTQNIDTLESQAGVSRVLQCHGSFATASCLRCRARVPGHAIEEYIMEQRIPFCPTCAAERRAQIAALKRDRKEKGKGKYDSDSDSDALDPWRRGEPGIIKPDITFFGQALDSAFDECLFRDREEVDLLVIIGTSLKVAPVSEVLSHIPHSVPQIFINLTPVTHVRPDILLLGDADSIVSYLSHELGWEIPRAEGEKPLAIKPEDAVWVSGEGVLSHFHMLRSRAERDALALSGQTVRLTVSGESVSGSASASDSEDSEASGEGEEAEVREEGAGGDENEGADDEGDGGLRPSSSSARPAKRSRMGSPASGESSGPAEQAKRSRVGSPASGESAGPAEQARRSREGSPASGKSVEADLPKHSCAADCALPPKA